MSTSYVLIRSADIFIHAAFAAVKTFWLILPVLTLAKPSPVRDTARLMAEGRTDASLCTAGVRGTGAA